MKQKNLLVYICLLNCLQIKFSYSSYKLTDEKVGKFLFNNALGGSFGSLSNKIYKKKNKQIIINIIMELLKLFFHFFTTATKLENIIIKTPIQIKLTNGFI